MQNIVEFCIIGCIGSVEIKDKVVFFDIVVNYGCKVGNEWEDDMYWNCVILFGKNIVCVEKMGKGDLVYVIGCVCQSCYECNGEMVYGVDLIVDCIVVIVKNGRFVDDQYDDDV